MWRHIATLAIPRSSSHAARVTSRDLTSHDSTLTVTVAQRILDEGAQPLLAAAREAGLLGDALPSLKTFLRAVVSGKLDAVKVGGRWLTSPSAVRRYVEQLQQGRHGAPPVATADAASAAARSAVTGTANRDTGTLRRAGGIECSLAERQHDLGTERTKP